MLQCLLRGFALKTYSELPSDIKNDWTRLTNTLLVKLQPRELPRFYQQSLIGRQKQKGESVVAFATAILKGVKGAFPTLVKLGRVQTTGTGPRGETPQAPQTGTQRDASTSAASALPSDGADDAQDPATVDISGWDTATDATLADVASIVANAKDVIAWDLFIMGLDRDLYSKVVEKEPKTFTEAVDIA